MQIGCENVYSLPYLFCMSYAKSIGSEQIQVCTAVHTSLCRGLKGVRGNQAGHALLALKMLLSFFHLHFSGMVHANTRQTDTETFQVCATQE